MTIKLIALLIFFLIFNSILPTPAQIGNTAKIEVVNSQSLPKPSGLYQVGTSVSHLIDTSRPDTISNKSKQFREIMLQIWYPTDLSSKGKTASYLPNPAILKTLLEAPYNFQSPAVIEGFKNVRTNAVLNAPLSKKQAKYSLLFFSHGLGEPRSNYTALSQDLASHGYIVVTIDHPYGGYTVLPDGRVLTTNTDPRGGTPEGAALLIQEWAKDASFIVNRLNTPDKSDSAIIKRITKHIDFEKVGMLGHSLGGAAALEACRTDSRFKACADLDGAPFGKVREEGVKRPTLIMRQSPIYSDEDLAKKGRTREQWEQMGREGKKMWNSILPKNKEIPLYSIKVAGTGHMSYSDAPFVAPDTITRFGGRIIDSNLSFVIISSYVRDFFNKYLKGEKSKLLDNANAPYSEVSIEKTNL